MIEVNARGIVFLGFFASPATIEMSENRLSFEVPTRRSRSTLRASDEERSADHALNETLEAAEITRRQKFVHGARAEERQKRV